MLRRTGQHLCRSVAAAAAVLPVLMRVETGHAASKDWRMRFKEPATGAWKSAWHDLPLRPGAQAETPLFTFVTEIPRGTRAKFELCKEEAHNPLKQDLCKGTAGQPLRFFRYGDMPFNYGFIPRTWEDPEHVDPITDCVGDGDPIDVVHLGAPHRVGHYEAVRVLGVLGLLDQGETDWKIIVESASGEGEGYGSLSKVPPSVRATIIDWFENYKVPEGKRKNEFAFQREIQSADLALDIIDLCASQYTALVSAKCPNPGYWLP